LFRDPTVDGLKTGHTDAAGYCLVATAKRDFLRWQSPGAPAGTPVPLEAVVCCPSCWAARAKTPAPTKPKSC